MVCCSSDQPRLLLLCLCKPIQNTRYIRRVARLPPGCVPRRVPRRLPRLQSSFFPRAVRKLILALIHPLCCATKWDFTIQIPTCWQTLGRNDSLLKWVMWRQWDHLACLLTIIVFSPMARFVSAYVCVCAIVVYCIFDGSLTFRPTADIRRDCESGTLENPPCVMQELLVS